MSVIGRGFSDPESNGLALPPGVPYAKKAMAETPKRVAIVDWYRSPLPPELFKQLHERSGIAGLPCHGDFIALHSQGVDGCVVGQRLG